MQKWEENFLKTKNNTINDIIDNILKKRRWYFVSIYFI
jgi:hypothetical protein